MPADINSTLAEMKKAITSGNDYAKAWNVAFGIVNYDLEAGAKLLFPWGASITPLRNEIARKKGNGDTSHHWKSITAINSGKTPIGVSEGNRGGVMTSTEQDKSAVYAGLGLEDYVTEEARYAAEGFEDALATASENLLKAVMISEEQMILLGNASVLLGTPATPALTAPSTSAGVLSNGTFYVVVVALSGDGQFRATVASGVVQQIVRTNADGSSDTINGGTSIPSAVANITLSGGTTTQNLGMSTPAIKGAMAYAWYVGTSASHQYLAAITTINSYVLNAAVPASSFQDAQALTASDFSNTTTKYGFDGILYSAAFGSGTNAYYAALASGTAGAGTQMTTDNAGGIAEINTALKDRYDNYRLSPDTLWCNSQEIQSIKTLVIKNGGAPLIRFAMDKDVPAANMIAGASVGFYLNPYTNTLLNVRVHPFAVPGTITFTSKEAPYAGSRVSTLLTLFFRQEYYSTLWPMRTRKREYGVYVDETLANYFPPAFGAITNIAPTTS